MKLKLNLGKIKETRCFQQKGLINQLEYQLNCIPSTAENVSKSMCFIYTDEALDEGGKGFLRDT